MPNETFHQAWRTAVENKDFLTVVGIMVSGTIARALKRKKPIDWTEFGAEMIVAVLLAVGIWHTGLLQKMDVNAVIVGAVAMATGLGTLRSLQWIVRIAAALSKLGKVSG
jgi:hypothetical protein